SLTTRPCALLPPPFLPFFFFGFRKHAVGKDKTNAQSATLAHGRCISLRCVMVEGDSPSILTEFPAYQDSMELTPETIERALTTFSVMLVSLTMHEAAHALAAKLCGDDTAERQGRLTLNPLRHVEPFGTVLLPLAGALSGIPVVGWAKPVPVDLSKVRHPR